jgi:hypothetical protein
MFKRQSVVCALIFFAKDRQPVYVWGASEIKKYFSKIKINELFPKVVIDEGFM